VRPFRQDVTGVIDANGNASMSVKLPGTGEWHALKVSLSTSGPAEWAILVSGTAITYGRGRRVTLGPELIQDGETVAITVTGGPPAATIIGAVTGKSGTPDEILLSYVPQPNTIAVDTASTAIVLQRIPVAAGGNANVAISVPTGTVAVGWQLDALVGDGQGPLAVSFTGIQSGDLVGSWAFPFSGQALFAVPLGPADTSIRVSVTARGASACAIYVLAWSAAPAAPLPTTVEASTGAELLAVSEALATPAPWQAAASSATTRVAPGALNTDFTIVPGVAGQTIYLHDVEVNTNAGATWEVDLWDGPSAGGAKVADFFVVFVTAVGAGPPVSWDGRGRPLTAGNALVGTLVTGPAGSTIFGTYGFTRQ